MKLSFASVRAYALAHKAVSAAAILAVALSGYGVYRKTSTADGQTTYTLAQATRGALVDDVSGSGQVEAADQEDVSSTVSGDIVAVLVKAGDKVAKWQTLARIDTKDAVKAVSNAELAFQNAQLSYDRAAKAAQDQAPGAASSDLVKSYQDGYSAIANTSIDLPTIIAGMHDIFYDPSHSPYFSDIQISNIAGAAAVGYKYQAGVAFDAARNQFDANYSKYKSVSASSAPADIEALLHTTDSILKGLLSSLTGAYNTIDFVSDRYVSSLPSQIATDKTTISGYVSKVNSDINSIAAALTSIDAAQDSPASASLSLKTAELSVSQAKDALDQARQDLADHSVRAPWDGVVAKVPAKAGDKATNGTAIATVISFGKLVRVSLNEIDAAKVSVGNKVTLTFDAIDGLTLAGHVSAVDLVGTVSQGVVTYSVEIAFDDSDERVKPGMTVNADIVTSIMPDALLVPVSAVKTQGAFSYVQTLPDAASTAAPKQVQVSVVGSNDEFAAIGSGISEGDYVVAKTMTKTAASTAASSGSLLNSLSGRRATGGAAAGAGAVRAGGTVFFSR